MLITLIQQKGHNDIMRDWAIDYIRHVLKEKGWTANRLATEAGVAASTINRPLREKDWPHKISRATLAKIKDASGEDFEGYELKNAVNIPLLEEKIAPNANTSEIDLHPTEETMSLVESAVQNLTLVRDDRPNLETGDIQITILGDTAHIEARIHIDDIDRLRKKLDALEIMLSA